MNTQDIINEQRTLDEFTEAFQMIVNGLVRSEEQINQIEAYIKAHEKGLMEEYGEMIKEAMENDTPIGFYDIWAIGKADRALFG